MIAITLLIRPRDSSLWLDFVRHRLRRFESVAIDDHESLLWIPHIGSLVVTDGADGIELQSVVRSGAAASILRARITAEISAAVPESLGGERLSLDWTEREQMPDLVSARRDSASRRPGGADALR
jgi:hypothetical protein